MRADLVEMLACPACRQGLAWAIKSHRGDRVKVAEAQCESCGANFPIREGIGAFLASDLPRHDVWEEVESRLSQYLREHPQAERRLMEAPLEGLSPADQFLCAMVLDEPRRIRRGESRCR